MTLRLGEAIVELKAVKISARQCRNDGVAAASSDGGPPGGRGPRQFGSISYRPTVINYRCISMIFAAH